MFHFRAKPKFLQREKSCIISSLPSPCGYSQGTVDNGVSLPKGITLFNSGNLATRQLCPFIPPTLNELLMVLPQQLATTAVSQVALQFLEPPLLQLLDWWRD
jgi:hypothetical protein